MANAGDSYEELARAKRGGFFERVNQRFQDVIQNSRGSGEEERNAASEGRGDPHVTADDIAIRRARSVRPQRMVIPEGVIINGSLTGGSETEIEGRIEGDITVDGKLTLGRSALVSGNVRAVSCQISGLVEGRVECSQDIELATTGRLNSDVMVGRRMNVEGQVFGAITCSGRLRLAASCKVNGDIRTRLLLMEEGAIFNGMCVMRTPQQRGNAKPNSPAEK